ncbi:MAG: CBS domain-containing protein [Actinomycetota bacterium]|nr:CBS domain-containing protein [Actinomycetota bacterium]
MAADLVRDAMVPEPRALRADESAQEAARLLARPGVRAVFVAQDERLVGVITRGTLVRAVVAEGRHPAETPAGEIAEEPRYTLESSLSLDAAFRFLEEHDAERVPVTEDGRLVGVLSRSVVQRRLAEDEPPEPEAELE